MAVTNEVLEFLKKHRINYEIKDNEIYIGGSLLLAVIHQ